MTAYDLIIIGAGPGGYETAAEAAAMGLNVLLVERDHPGGTCLNRGCIPTKALCRSAEVMADVRRAAAFGVNLPEGAVSFDLAAAQERKARVVGELREGIMELLRDVTYLHGEARFTDARTIEVAGESYTAPRIIVATGSAPALLPVEGAELAMTSDDLLNATSLPESIAIIGGGVIGMEFASMLAAVGVAVTLVEYCPEILPAFDGEIAKRLRMMLKRRGVKTVTGAAVTAITALERGYRVSYTAKGREQGVEAATVLMAVGRRPVLPEGLTETGVATDRRGFITVDERMQTSVEGIYAVGDVNGRCMLAHAATAQGRVALGLDQRLDPVPSVVFTLPECAAVGLTEEQCQQRDIDFTVGRATFRANGKAMAMDEPDGLVKMIVERTTRRILGCHICGPHASDLIAEPALAIAAGLTADTVASTIHAHPTLAESLAAALR